ncbi:NADH-cytochrome b5 reductase 1 [Myriangium duriaei CBS 260.36]|uniref:NADH-cytochrome b5 reductase n=1 Tax=Myriangium duriaei CBS 260.36 TaxID=1168546 RepID=A0A9P4MIP4_9PEZI|nr:NADH-cytochrome b5 reductase 1 [Myriangium duriaei CBS 260.36]
MAAPKESGPLASHYINGVYIPSTLLIFTVALVKIEYTPVAIAIAAVLAGYQFFAHNSKSKPALDPVNFQTYPLTEKKVLSHNTAVYRFGLPSSDAILGLPIGQHISLAATLDVTDPKTSKTERREVVRSYTPISSDHERGYFDLLVKAYPTGNISRHLTTLSVGDKMKVKGPKGAMVYTPNMVRHFGMIAGGTGITPMLQIIRAVLRGRKSGDKTQVDLIFANVNEEDILLREDLDKLALEDPGFRVHYVLNNPPAGWTGGVGFVTPELIKKHLPAPASDVKILVCGPPPMVSAMKKATESLGFSKARPVSKLEDQVFCF